MALGQPQLTVQVDADTAKALAQIVAFSKAAEATLRDIKASFGDFYDSEKSKREADAAGRDNANSYHKGFTKAADKNDRKQTTRFKRKLALWGGLIAAFGETVGVALYGATGALVSLGASMLSAISASAALVPIMFGLGAAITAIVVGSQGVGDAFGAINEEFKAAVKEGREFNANAEGITEALKGMAPAAQAFVKEAANLRVELGEIQKRVQEKLFEGLADELKVLGEPGGVISQVGTAFQGFASIANSALKGVLDVLVSSNLGGIFTAIAPAIDAVGRSLAPLTDAFLDFLRVAAPFAVTLAEQFEQWAKSLAKFTSSAEGVEAIQGFLDRALASLQAWIDLIGAAGKLISTVMKLAAEEGDSLIGSLTGKLREWNDTLNSPEGRDAFVGFLETSTRILKALGPILEGAKGLFKELVTDDAVGRFEDLAKTLGKLLPLFGKLLSIFGESGIVNIFADAILGVFEAAEKSGLLDALKQLASTIGQSLQKVLDRIIASGVLDMLGQALVVVVDAVALLIDALFSNQAFMDAFQEGLAAIGEVIVALVPLFLEWVPILLELVPIFTSILELLPPLADLIMALMPAIELIIGAAAAWIGAMVDVQTFITGTLLVVIEGLIVGLTWLVDTITGAVDSAIKGLASAWRATTEDIKSFYDRNIAPIVGKLREFATKIREIWDGLWKAVVDVYNEFFGSFASDIKGVIDKVVGFFRDWKDNVGKISEAIEGFINDIVGFFKALPGKITGALSGLYDAITAPFQKAWDKVSGLVGNITGAIGKIPGAGAIGNAVGGIFRNNAAGGLYGQATHVNVGEAGREAIIPLDRPLRLVDPSVREMAALLRNEGPRQGRGRRGGEYGPSKITNNSFVINEVGNADATAQRVLNRLTVAI